MRHIDLKKRAGFSLIELSVVMVIIGILIYMTLSMGRQQLEIAKIKQTRYKLEKIQNALAIYYKTYGHMPCPADGTAATTDSANFGKEAGYNNPTGTNFGDATCSSGLGANGLITDALQQQVYIGVAPVITLGMPLDAMMDGWGNRITYVVSTSCVDPDNWNTGYKYRCGYSASSNTIDGTKDGGRITLQDKNNNSMLLNTVTFAVDMLISHGHYGYGAWSNKGTKITMAGGLASDAEYYNGNLSTSGAAAGATGGRTIYYDMPINDGDNKPKYFDNLTNWTTAPQIYYYANH